MRDLVCLSVRERLGTEAESISLEFIEALLFSSHPIGKEGHLHVVDDLIVANLIPAAVRLVRLLGGALFLRCRLARILRSEATALRAHKIHCHVSCVRVNEVSDGRASIRIGHSTVVVYPPARNEPPCTDELQLGH